MKQPDRTVILAGHDTSAASLVWTLWELAKHPEDQDRIRAEVAAARANTSGEFTPADYEGMVYLNAVIKVCEQDVFLVITTHGRLII